MSSKKYFSEIARHDFKLRKFLGYGESGGRPSFVSPASSAEINNINKVSTDKTGDLASSDRTGDLASSDKTGDLASSDEAGGLTSPPPIPQHKRSYLGSLFDKGLAKHSKKATKDTRSTFIGDQIDSRSTKYYSDIFTIFQAISESNHVDYRKRQLKPLENFKESKLTFVNTLKLASEKLSEDNLDILKHLKQNEKENLISEVENLLQVLKENYNGIKFYETIKNIKPSKNLKDLMPLLASTCIGRPLLILSSVKDPSGTHCRKFTQIARINPYKFWTSDMQTALKPIMLHQYADRAFYFKPCKVIEADLSEHLNNRLEKLASAEGRPLRGHFMLASQLQEEINIFFQSSMNDHGYRIHRVGNELDNAKDSDNAEGSWDEGIDLDCEVAHDENNEKPANPDKTYRVLANMVPLNDRSVPCVTVLPNIDQCCEKFAKSKVLSSFDISNYYFSINVTQNYSETCSFVTEDGFYSPSYLIQGDASAVAAASYVSELFLKDIEEVSSVLLDDICLGGQSALEHLDDFGKLLDNMRGVSEAGNSIKLNPTKIHLLADNVVFCGRKLSKGQLIYDSSKPCIYLQKRPDTISDLSSLISFVSYFRAHIADASGLLKPLNDQVKENPRSAMVQWTDDLNQAYLKVKAKMIALPKLFIPDSSATGGVFRVFIDASGYAIGSLLTQDKVIDGKTRACPLIYHSSLLQNAEKNYSIVNCEVLALAKAVDRWAHFLRGRPFVCYTDSSYCYWAIRKVLAGDAAPGKTTSRLVQSLAGHQFRCVHLKSELHPADSFSRNVERKIKDKVEPMNLPEILEDGTVDLSRYQDSYETEIVNIVEEIESDDLHLAKQHKCQPSTCGPQKAFPSELQKGFSAGSPTTQTQSINHPKFQPIPLLENSTFCETNGALSNGSANQSTNQIHVNQCKLGPHTEKDSVSDPSLCAMADEGQTPRHSSQEELTDQVVVANVSTRAQSQLAHDTDLSVENTDEFISLQRSDERLNKLVLEIEKLNSKKDNLSHHKPLVKGKYTFKLVNRILLAKVREGDFRYVLPKVLQEVVAKRRHCLAHNGISNTLAQISNQFFWESKYTSDENMIETCEAIVKTCLKCQFFSKKAKNRATVYPLLHMSQNKRCFESYVLDIWHAGPKNTSQYKYLVAAVCTFCRKAYVRPVKNATSAEVSRFIIEELCSVALPRFILSDHGANVTLAEVRDLYESVNAGLDALRRQGRCGEDVPRLEQKKSTVFRPFGHALVERFFGSFAMCLRRLLADHPDNWHLLAGRVAAIYNVTPHRALGNYTPNMIHFRLPRQSLFPDVFDALDAANATSAFARKEQETNRVARDIVQTKMNHYFEITDKQWNKKITKKPDVHPFQPGTLVLVRKMGVSKKLNTSYWWGPGIVLRTIGRTCIDIQYILNGVEVRRDISQCKLFNLPLDPNDPDKIYYNAPKRGTEGSETFYVDSNPPTYAESKAEEVFMNSESLKREKVDLSRSFAACAQALDNSTGAVSDADQKDHQSIAKNADQKDQSLNPVVLDNSNSTGHVDKNELSLPIPDCDPTNVPDTFSNQPFRRWQADQDADSYLDRTITTNETIAPCMSISPPTKTDGNEDDLNVDLDVDDDDSHEAVKKRISFAEKDSIEFIEPRNNNNIESKLLPIVDKTTVPLRRSARIQGKQSDSQPQI